MEVLVRKVRDLGLGRPGKLGSVLFRTEPLIHWVFPYTAHIQRKLGVRPRAAEEPILAFSAPTLLGRTETLCQKWR